LQAAVRLLELNVLSKTRDKVSAQMSLEEAITEEALPVELRSEVRALLEARGATIYGHLGSECLTDDERVRIKNVLDRLKAVA
jgi:hypothetical protein